MNRTILVGRIVRDIQLRKLDSGNLVTNNVIAINRVFKNDGNKQSADFIPFVARGRRAELIERYCDKGDMIALEGKLQSRTYETKDKEKKYVVELNVDTVQFLQNKKEEADILEQLSK